MRGVLCALFFAGTFLFAGGQSVKAEVNWFDLSDYQEMKKNDRQTLELVLSAMLATVFYAQESIDKPAICASPALIRDKVLVAMVDREIETPTHPQITAYADNTHVAFVLLNALKQVNACQ